MSAEIILMPARRSGFVRYCVGALADLTFVNRARKFTNLLGRHTDHQRAQGGRQCAGFNGSLLHVGH